ncbi:MAG TPA: hypothetical protein VIF82_04735 [Burkholderiaceae bacterium]|jgi:hypothetical protein
MKTTAAVLMVSLSLIGCATSAQPDATDNSDNGEHNSGATSLTVTTASNAREVLQSIPPGSAMERFEALDLRGHLISYVALTDTTVGGLVFIDQKLAGTISKQDARAFYSCRGYSTAIQNHWAKDASAWTDSLLSSITPATSVQLDFSGMSTLQSIKGVVGNPMVNQVKSLVDMGTNPFNILKTLYTTRDDMKDREEFKKTQLALSAISPGAEENQVAAIIKPEDVSFVADGLVMAYPKFSVEFYLSGGIVKVIQQPSFYQLSRTQAALFYAPKAQWALCTPQKWREALPKIGPDAKVEVKTEAKQGG